MLDERGDVQGDGRDRVRLAASAAALLVLAGIVGCAERASRSDQGERPLPPGEARSVKSDLARGSTESAVGTIAGRDIIVVGSCERDALAPASPGAPKSCGVSIIDLPVQTPKAKVAIERTFNRVRVPGGLASMSGGGELLAVIDQGAGRGATALSIFSRELDVDDEAMRSLAALPIRQGARAVAVSTDGLLVAVATDRPRPQVQLVHVKRRTDRGGERTVHQPVGWHLAGLDFDDTRIGQIAWHPDGSLLAATLPDRGEVMFMRVTKDERGIEVSPLCTPLKIGGAPFAIAFGPGGEVLAVSDLGAMPTAETDWQSAALEPGRVVAIRVGPERSSEAGEAAALPIGRLPPASERFTVVGRVGVGRGPVALAIARPKSGGPAETLLVACANLRASDAESQGSGSLSLMSIGPDTALMDLGERPIAARPAGLSFDRDGRWLAVAHWVSLDPHPTGGEIGVYPLQRGARGVTIGPPAAMIGALGSPHSVVITP
jgi:hypothetical protein